MSKSNESIVMRGADVSPQPPSSGAAELPSAGRSVQQESDNLAILIRLLKIGSFINTPMKEAVCDPADITRNEVKIIMALAGEGALAGHDLVHTMGITPMNVSRALASLRKRGWVEDVADKDNRRRRPVRLTKKGVGAYDALGPLLVGLADELVGPLTARERDRFAKLADKVTDSMIDWIASHDPDALRQ